MRFMQYTRTALVSVWLITLGLVAMSGSGRIAGPTLLILVFAALVAPAILLTVVPKLWPAPIATAPHARATATEDANDLARMDSDKG